MAMSRLRVYYGPEDASTPVQASSRHTVTVPLADVLPALADAVKNRRAWVGDFADEEITLSSDLYEVLLAYEHYRRPSA
jgi:hypothetical protein